MRKVNVGCNAEMIPNYKLEFILHTHSATNESIKSSLSEFGENLVVSECNEPDRLENHGLASFGQSHSKGNNFTINLITQDPTVIFDICAQIGRIRQIKINEEGG